MKGYKSRIELNEQCGNVSDDIIKDKAEEIMTTGNPVEFIIDTHQESHVGDRAIAYTLLASIGTQSVLNSGGIQPKVSGESGKGKTHCCKAMAHLVPEGYVVETSLSGKAIFYMNLDPSMIIFSDDVDIKDNLEGTIKRSMTNFQEGAKHNTLDINRSSVEMCIPPRICWWLTSVDDDHSTQLSNRLFGCGADDSREQDQKVHDFQVEEAKNGRVALPKSKNVLICREIIGDIKEQLFTVNIPFADKIVWPDTSNRRNFPIFLDLIKGFTVFRFKQRQYNDAGALLAEEEDFNSAAELYNTRAINQHRKLTDKEIGLLEALKALGGRATTKELASQLELDPSRIHHMVYGRKDRPDTGLVNKRAGISIESQRNSNNREVKYIVLDDTEFGNEKYEVKLKED
jgi:hypothetical protein